MMRGCFGIGGTVPRPRSIRQIIGRSHRRRPLVNETSAGPSQLSTSADDFSILPSHFHPLSACLSNTLPSKMSLFRNFFSGSCVATDLRHPLKTLSNPSSTPPTIMLSFIFTLQLEAETKQNKTRPKGRKHNNQSDKSTRRCIMQQSTTNQRTINCGGEV